MKKRILTTTSSIAIILANGATSSVSAQDNDTFTLDEIIVTATRRAVSANDIPYNISATSGETLERAGVTDFSKLSRMVPGLAYIDQGARDAGVNSTLIIRGLNADAANGSDQASLAAQTVSTYVDETPIFVNLHLYDIERVEVLRGPQGTLYGSGSLGGTIRYLHKKPDPSEFTAKVDAKLSKTKYASGLSHDFAAVINAPVTDNFAVRVAGGYVKNQGFIDATRIISLDDDLTPTFVDPDNPWVSSLQEEVVEDHDDADLWHVRASALLNVGDNVTINLSWQHQEDRFDGAQVANTEHPDGGEFASTASIMESLDRTVDVAALDLEIDLGFATLSSSTSYYKNKYELRSDQNGIYLNSSFWYLYLYGSGGYLYYDGFGAENVLGLYDGETEGFAQEVRLASNSDGPLQWLIGGFYLDQNLKADQIDINTGNWELLGYPDSYGLEYGDAISTLRYKDTIFRNDINTKYRDLALFGELTYNFTDRLAVTAGARVFDQKYSNDATIYLNYCGAFCSNDGVNPYGKTGGSEEASFNDQIFKLNVAYDLTDDIMAYATWSEGFRHGGSNGIPTTESSPGAPFAEDPALATYDSDKATNIEIGAKGRTADGRVQFSVAAFQITWDNIQLGAGSPVGAFPILINGNKAKSTGLEAEVTAAITENLTVTSGYAHANARLTEDFSVGGISGSDGDRLPGTPKHMLSWMADYVVPMDKGDLTFHVNGSYMSGTKNPISPLQAGDTKSVSLWDANIRYQTESWSVGLFVDNLFNKRHETAQRGARYNSYDLPGFNDPSVTNYAGTLYEGLSFNDVRTMFASPQDESGKQLQHSVNRPRTIGLNFSYSF